MFHDLITHKRDQWLASPTCPVTSIVSYMERQGKMRDAQVEAVKTWLYLKIGCGNRPLWRIFSEEDFSTINFDNIGLTTAARRVLTTNRAAANLYEYACMKDDDGNYVTPRLKEAIEQHAAEIDFEETLRRFFYGVSYPDYIFSLPMGAGKTWLMAAFIYLDLYYSGMEPDNPAFAHNFIVMAPSGLKAAVVPSLRHIREFDPTWILPEPAAGSIKNLIQFEVLDELKTASRGNIVRNPNAQKINNHYPFTKLRGLVAVCNAEKVILDSTSRDSGQSLYSQKELMAMEDTNELRSIIGRLPRLSVFIDEVHHASDSEIRLRQVVSQWAANPDFCSVLGFSGTPYLAKADPVSVVGDLSISNKNLANVVYHYPLVNGIGNFLKVPVIRSANSAADDIVGRGLTEFFSRFGNVTYGNGTRAKCAIYCTSIEDLEEHVLPQVSAIVSKYVTDPSAAILKYHRGNKQHPQPAGAEAAFALLNNAASPVRVILLVGIGREGWDCKSLAAVILPQKGASQRNNILQTSCRCLRQVVRYEREDALIWLNAYNAAMLNQELERQQRTSIDDLNNGGKNALKELRRYSRMERLRVPPIDFYQLKVTYQDIVIDGQPDTVQRLQDKDIITKARETVIRTQEDMSVRVTDKQTATVSDSEGGQPVTFRSWLHTIAKESFGGITFDALWQQRGALGKVFDTITTEADGIRVLDGGYAQREIRSAIRLCFFPKRRVNVREEVIPEEARLLVVGAPSSPIYVTDTQPYYPSQKEVSRIIANDADDEKALRPEVTNPQSYQPHRDAVERRTYHYLPYRFDSSLEKEFFSESLLAAIKDNHLEVYFNGDETLTEFRISCYRQTAHGWRYDGHYVPDFLMLSRNADGSISQILIIETKGEYLSERFKSRRRFMDKFVALNNGRFGYDRFSFLYIEDSLSPDARDRRTLDAINKFFKTID